MNRPNLARDPYALTKLMEFDHVVRVHADGSVTDAGPAAPWAPTLYWHEVDEFAELHGQDGWRLMSGYTGQYGYNGPVMHPSEFIGGGLAEDILETPGLYVALVVEVLPECQACDWREDCAPDCRQGSHSEACPVEEWPAHTCEDEPEPAGWVVARITD